MLPNNLHIVPILGLFLSLTSLLIAQQPLINEVMYSNKSTLEDADGDTPDWIELYNPSEESINLKGYKISDDTTAGAPWVFPEYELKPNEYLVIFSSGKNRKVLPEFHTDFKLKSNKEGLFLFNPFNELIDQFAAQCVPTDKSLGRAMDGLNNIAVLSPTPGTSNNPALIHEINFHPDTLSINYNSGIYSNSITIKLNHTNANNSIYYTLDSEEPNANSLLYSGSIVLHDISKNEIRFADKPDDNLDVGDLIFKGNVLRAIVYSDGCPASNEIANTYLINSKLDDRYHVPVVSIITDEENLFDDDIGIYMVGNHTNYAMHGKNWERQAHFEYFDTNGIQVINQDIGIRLHGRSSRGKPQKSFRLYARDEYGKDKISYPFFSQKPHLNTFKTLLLRSVNDWSGTLFKDELCQHLVEEMHINYTASETVIAFVNGEYWGIYNIRERMDEAYIGNNYSIVDSKVDIISYSPEGYNLDEGDMEAFEELMNWIEYADPQAENFYQEADEKIDLKQFIDFYIAQFVLANTDFPNNNTKLWRIKSDTAKWRFFFFDLDAALTRPNFNHLSSYDSPYRDYKRYPDWAIVLLQTMLENEQFSNEFQLNYYYHINNTFSTERMLKYIDKYEKLYDYLVAEHTYRWHAPVDYIKWKENLDILRTFALQRPYTSSEQVYANFSNPFTIYPNPSGESFQIDFIAQASVLFQVQIFALDGKLVYNKNFSMLELPVVVNHNFNSGLYIMQLQIENMVFTDKISVL